MVKLLASIAALFIGGGDAFQPAISSVLQRHVGVKIDTKTLLQSTIINMVKHQQQSPQMTNLQLLLIPTLKVPNHRNSTGSKHGIQ